MGLPAPGLAWLWRRWALGPCAWLSVSSVAARVALGCGCLGGPAGLPGSVPGLVAAGGGVALGGRRWCVQWAVCGLPSCSAGVLSF